MTGWRHRVCAGYRGRLWITLALWAALAGTEAVRNNGSASPAAQPGPGLRGQGEATAQTKPAPPATLADLIAQTAWDATRRGPLLAIDPAHVRVPYGAAFPTADATGGFYAASLAVFRRMLARSGGISAIVPTEMTLIHDRPVDPPNLYEGLPLPLKIRYLLATLSPVQWKALRERGLGLRDLTAEQRPVYLSILPDPFKYNRWQYDKNGKITVESGNTREQTITLSPDERAQVRLRVYQRADVTIAFADDAHTFLGTTRDLWKGQPFAERLARNTVAEREDTRLYGVALSASVPNKLKTSSLNYEAAQLDAPVALEGITTVGDLMTRIVAATRVEVVADGRVARLPVILLGGKARAGDLLRALALGVTGTYRKVDSLYLLTSDQTGIGAQQLRLTEWQAQIHEEVARLEVELTRQIGLHSGTDHGIHLLGFAAGDPYALTPEVAQEAAEDQAVTSDRLPPALARWVSDYATTFNKRNVGHALNPDLVGLTLNWQYAFQLPDGRALNSEGRLATFGEFKTPPAPPQPAAPARAEAAPKFPLPLPVSAAERVLFLTPDGGPEQATEAVQLARHLGFTALGLRTEDPATLRAASHAAGSSLRLYALVAPFAPARFRADPGVDRNLIDESAADVVAARGRSALWQKYVAALVKSAAPPPIPERVAGVPGALSPLSAAIGPRLRDIAEIAGTPGLAGLLFYDTQPGGYAGRRPDGSQANYDRNNVALLERENLGYTQAMRAAFLRQEGVDPIDLIPRDLRLDIDLPRPFFPDPEATYHYYPAMSDEMYQLAAQWKERWDLFRAGANRKRMADLFAAVRAARPDLPLSVQARAEQNNEYRALGHWPAWVAWTQPERLPVATEDLYREPGKSALSGDPYLRPLQFSNSDDLLPARSALLRELQRLQRVHAEEVAGATVALDLSYLPGARTLALLRECIAPPAPR